MFSIPIYHLFPAIENKGVRMKKLIVVLLLICSICKSSDKINVDNLTCDYQINPLGIENAQPRLSWQLACTERGAKQTAYQILAASDSTMLSEGRTDLWDSGKTPSDQSTHIVYSGRPLSSRALVYWKVRVWDLQGQATEWSDIAHWEIALGTSDWKADWIGAPNESDDADSSPLFRNEFSCREKPVRARAYVTGLGYYECYVNDGKIGDAVLAPAQTNYDRRRKEEWTQSRIGNMKTRVLYNVFDITDAIHSGANAVGMWLGSGWYRQNDRLDDVSLWYDTPRCLVQIEIEYEDGSRQIVVSNEEWKTAPSPIVHNGLHTGEIYDARLEQPAWTKPGFDDFKWRHATRVRAPDGELHAQVSPPDRVIKYIAPVSVTSLDDSTTRFDFGQMFSGWIQLTARAHQGEKIRFKFIEELGPTYGQTDSYIFRGDGTETWEPRFTWHAFRYVDAISHIPLKKDNLIGCVVNTEVDTVGYFTSANDLFNQIQENARWTQLGNMHGGIPSDCPHRERRGYTGDGQLAARAAMYHFDMATFYTKWLDDIFDAQNGRTGYVPNTTPFQDGGGGTAWGSACVLIPWDMYLHYGDARILETYYSSMKAWFDYMTNELDERGILINQGLGEWVPPDLVSLPPDFVNSCYYFLNCHLLDKIAGILNQKNDRLVYQEAAKKSTAAINKIYYNLDGGFYATGSQGADVLPLAFGIVPDEYIPAVLAHLKNHVTNKCQGHFDTGILATPLLLQVLTDHGMVDLAYTLMNQRSYPSFGYMIEQGATTIWETWQGDASHSHPMFGSVCTWFYGTLAGIRSCEAEPGFKKTIIMPHPVRGLENAAASINTMFGIVSSKWRIRDNDFILDVTIPANCRAEVLLPAVNMNNISKGGRPLSDLPEVDYRGMRNGRAVIEIESGEYHFVSKNCASLFPSPVAEAPTITPPDTLAFQPDSVLIKISHPKKGAILRFTLDGSEPVGASSKYSGPFTCGASTQIKAKAWMPDGGSGFTQERIIQFIDPKQNGLTVDIYDGAWEKLPDFEKMMPAKTMNSFRLNFDELNLSKDVFGLVYTGYLEIQKTGDYTFYVQSNDGSKLWLGDSCVVDHDGQHGPDEKSASLSLQPGRVPLRLEYFQAGGGLYLSVSYSGPDLEKQEIPPFRLFR
jgi:alpha-L-rhamnosidase